MTSSHKPRRSRKASALIAATAVLGVATVGTLATWTVTEYVSSTFRTVPEPQGSIEASVDGVTFSAHHTSSEAATLNWSADPESMIRGQTVVAPYYLRTTPGTLSEVQIATVINFSGDFGNFDFAYYPLDSVDAPCTVEVADQKKADGIPAGGVFNIPAATLDTAGTPKKVCVVFRTVEDTKWGSFKQVLWRFEGTPVS